MKIGNIFFYIAGIVILGVFLFFYGYMLTRQEKHFDDQAKEGVFDLRAWKTDKKKYVPLKGEWEFYWQELIDPSALKEDKVREKQYFSMPDVWNNKVFQGKKLPPEGYATFFLRVLLPDTGHFALRINELDCAYHLWVNEYNIGTGVVGINKEEEVPSWKRKEIYFHTHKKSLDIVLQVSNFHHRKGGAEEEIVLGRGKNIYEYKKKQLAISFFLLGIILIMGVYHLVLFLYRRTDRSTLAFAIINFLLGLRLATTGEKVLLDIFPQIPWELAIRIEYLSFILAVPAVLAFIYSLFKEDLSKKSVLISSYIAVAVSLFVLVTPSRIFSFTPIFYQFIMVGFGFYILIGLVKAIKKKRENADIILAGYLFFFMIVLNDLFFYNKLIESSFYIPFGLFILIFSQAFVLSKHSSQVFNRVESLSKEMDKYSKNLEHLVEERTKTVEHQKLELEKQSLELQRTNAHLQILNSFKEDMMGMIVHDLKNPLNTIISMSQTSDPYRYKIAVREAGKNMMNLIMNLLDITKFEEAKLTLKAEEFYLSDILKEALLDVEYMAGQKNIKLVTNSYTDYKLPGDKELLKRVLVNLLTNAIKHSPGNEKVEIIVDDTQKEVVVHLLDKGMGIEEAQQKRIFEKFNTVMNINQDKYHSTGLGLAFCKIVIEAHGGIIGVTSQVEQGADFWFRLPFLEKGNTVSRHEMHYEEQEKIIQLNEDDFARIEEDLKKLKETKSYDISAILLILSEIEKKEIPYLRQWIGMIKEAAENCNDYLYQKLLRMVCKQ